MVSSSDRQEGNTYGDNNGTSNVNSFMLKSSNLFITDFQINCGSTPGSYLFSLSAQNNGDHNFSLTGITLNPTSTITTLSLSTLPATIVAGGNLSFSGTFNYSGTVPNMVVANISGHQVGNVYLTSSDTEIDTVKACLCVDCDNLRWNFNLSATKVSNNKYDLTGSLGVNLACLRCGISRFILIHILHRQQHVRWSYQSRRVWNVTDSVNYYK
ncbi:hypothetical protein MASR2M69_06230 [Bacteroidota bacterium]